MVWNRTPLAFPLLRTERFASVIFTRLHNSLDVIPRSFNTSSRHTFIAINHFLSLNKQVIVFFQPLHFSDVSCKQQHSQHKSQGKYRDGHHIFKLVKTALEKQLQ